MIGGDEVVMKLVACSNAVAILQKGDVDGFVVRVSELRSSMVHLNNEQIGKAVKPLEEFVVKECLRDDANIGFADVSCFNRYAEAVNSAVGQLGEVRLTAGPVPSPVVRTYEPLLLDCYRRCWKNALAKSREDVSAAAKREYDLLRKRIESKDGLTCRYMKTVLEREESVLRPLSGHAKWNLIKGVRSAAFDLVMAGVVPRWLDEDFGYDCLMGGPGAEINVSDWNPGISAADAVGDISRSLLRDLHCECIESPEEFRDYSMRLENVVRQKGETLINERVSLGSEICSLEAGVLELLLKYRALFAIQGRLDCVEIAEEESSRWKEFIDSRAGLTRRWAELVMKSATEDRDLERVLKEVRLQVCKLILSGHMPSWVDELARD